MDRAHAEAAEAHWHGYEREAAALAAANGAASVAVANALRARVDLRPSDCFLRRLTRRTPAPACGYRTRIITDGVEPSLHIEYKHSHLKQYFKEGHGLRSELTINNPNDFDFTEGLDQLPAFRALGDERQSHAPDR